VVRGGLSRSTLERLFTPSCSARSQRDRRIRLERAQELLRGNDLTLKQIAAAPASAPHVLEPPFSAADRFDARRLPPFGPFCVGSRGTAAHGRPA